MSAACFAVITGGGTAGHVLPAIAVAEALAAAGHAPESIHYVGAQRGIEITLVAETPFPCRFLDVVGFQRRLDRRNVAFVPKMLRSTREMIGVLADDRPDVVVSVGGYASVPSTLAARRLGIPVVVVSYDRTPGRASRLSARHAAACAVAFEGSRLPRAHLTGAPIRQSVLRVDRTADRAAARRALAMPDDRFLVTVMGGSQGSGALNVAVAEVVRSHRGDGDLAVLQIAGERFAANIEPVDEGAEGVCHRVVGYERDMAAVYAASDLLVGRGGASTVHEVAVTGTPAILVPWGDAADDHQTHNVRWLSDAGAAVYLREDRLAELGAQIGRLRADAQARAVLTAAARALGNVHRSGALAGLIERVAVASPSS